MSDLIPIEDLVETAIENFTKSNQNRLMAQLIALLQIQKKSLPLFNDFETLLMRFQSHEYELHIYQRYFKALQTHLKSDPFDALTCFFKKHDIDDEKLSKILINKSFNEGAVANRIVKNNNLNFARICIFYLLSPRFTQQFFVNELVYLDVEEKELIADYRNLPADLQDKILGYIKKLAAAAQFQDLGDTKKT